MNVLVTGASGYFGRTIVDHIKSSTDWNVLSPSHSEFDLSKPLSHDFQVNYIIHAAARRYGTLEECIVDNVVGTCNLLNFAKKQTNLINFVFISSNDIFGPGSEPRDEEAPINPQTPYAMTKAIAESICLHSNLPVATFRIVNILCPEPDPRKFPSICRRYISSEKKLTIYNGKRLYIHALDAADAVLFVLSRRLTGKFNITGVAFSNLEVAQIVADKIGKTLFYEIKEGGVGNEAEYNLSSLKLERLGWSLKMNPKDYI